MPPLFSWIRPGQIWRARPEVHCQSYSTPLELVTIGEGEQCLLIDKGKNPGGDYIRINYWGQKFFFYADLFVQQFELVE